MEAIDTEKVIKVLAMLATTDESREVMGLLDVDMRGHGCTPEEIAYVCNLIGYEI